MTTIPDAHIDGLLREAVLPARRRWAMTTTSVRAIRLALPLPEARDMANAMTAAYYMLGLHRLRERAA